MNNKIIVSNYSPQNIRINNIDTQDIKIESDKVNGIIAVYVNGIDVTVDNKAYVIVPTKLSELQNDEGFISEETDPTVPYYLKQITVSDINRWNTKQDELVSGYNIKTVNSQSLLGTGNIDISTSYSAGNGIEITEENVINNTVTSYDDLTDLPTIPTQTSELINNSGYITDSYHDDTKQDVLESGVNIKTINNESLLGSGNINISGGGGGSTDVQINGTSITSNDIANIQTEGVYDETTNKIATMSDLPTVNDGTMTLIVNRNTALTFTANQSTNSSASLTIPTKTSDLQNNGDGLNRFFSAFALTDTAGNGIKVVKTGDIYRGNLIYNWSNKNEIANLDDIKYKVNDIIEIGGNTGTTAVSCSGFITTSTKEVKFTIYTPKNLDNITTITVNNIIVELRGISGYLNSTSGFNEYVGETGYDTITATKTGSNSILIIIPKTSAFTNVTNNTPVSVFGYYKLTLS